MATALAQDKPKGKVTFRLLFRALEKSKINTSDQCRALMDLSVSFITNSKRRNEATFKQTLASTVRWYENNRQFLDKDILGPGLTYLYWVFKCCGYHSLVETIDRQFEGETCVFRKLLKKAIDLFNNHMVEDALSLLKTLEPKVKKFCEASEIQDLTKAPWQLPLVKSFFEVRADCHFWMQSYHLAIEDYSQSLAILDNCPLSVVPKAKLDDKYGYFEESVRYEMIFQIRRGISYRRIGYYEEAKSDLKIVQKKPPVNLKILDVRAFNSLCESFLNLKRFKHALLAAYQVRFYSKKLGLSANFSRNQRLLAKCLYEDKKFQEAQWLCSDLILDDCEDEIKATIFELNGHCLMEMNKYDEAIMNFTRALQLTCQSDRMRIWFALYKYAFDVQHSFHLTASQFVASPWPSYECYTYFPKLLMEKGRIESTVKFVIEKSIQEVKSKKSKEAKNHLMFCNSAMISMKFRK